MSFNIKEFDFHPACCHKGTPKKNLEPIKSLSSELLGANWPVVYILSNDTPGDKNLYVGESTSASHRMRNHVDNTIRKCFNKAKIIFDPTYNKSAVLDIEQTLINLFAADGYYDLQNANEGQSDAHDYYDRAYYQKLVQDIWQDLKKSGKLTINKDYNELVNSELFKFSPYTSLTVEQNDVCVDILNEILGSLGRGEKYVAMVQGGPGTGKSIVMMHMFHMLKNPPLPTTGGKISTKTGKADEVWEKLVNLKKGICEISKKSPLKVAYVCPMGALQSTIKTAVSACGIRRYNVVKPIDISKECDDYYDVIFVDEAHRLAHSPIGNTQKIFKDTNANLFGAQSDVLGRYTQLDWLLKKSKCVVMVFDEGQTVRDSDITIVERDYAFKRVAVAPEKFELKGQMRCNGGSLYTDFIRQLLDPKGTIPTRPDVGSYDIQVFDFAVDMIDEICNLDVTNKLCRVATGFGWQWVAKRYDNAKKTFSLNWNDPKNFPARTAHYIKTLSPKDGKISIGKHEYVRNIDPDRWMVECDPHEIGCVHTTQGFDFNYIGVIFGPEIDFDPEKGEIIVNYDKIADKNSLSNASVVDKRKRETMTPAQIASREKQITEDVLNVYNVLLTRGIRGCYMWAYNENMQNYLKQVFSSTMLMP